MLPSDELDSCWTESSSPKHESKDCSPSQETTRATIQATIPLPSALYLHRDLGHLSVEHPLKCDMLMEQAGRDQLLAFKDDPKSGAKTFDCVLKVACQ